jgi:hypothetical protein
MSELPTPDGIEYRHLHGAASSSLHVWPLNLAGLGILLVAALLGAFGISERVSASNDGVRLTVEGPKRIRSGEFFEMVFIVEAERRIGAAVLRVDEDIWHDVTINTMIPAAAEETSRDGAHEFHFGPIEAGSRFLWKVDGQINPAYPPELDDGAISIADSTSILATVEYSMRVLP